MRLSSNRTIVVFAGLTVGWPCCRDSVCSPVFNEENLRSGTPFFDCDTSYWRIFIISCGHVRCNPSLLPINLTFLLCQHPIHASPPTLDGCATYVVAETNVVEALNYQASVTGKMTRLKPHYVVLILLQEDRVVSEHFGRATSFCESLPRLRDTQRRRLHS